MEYVQKYWYLVLGALVLLFFISKRQSAGLVQVGGSDATTLTLAQMASAQRGADLDRQYSFANSLLNYDIANKQVGQTLDLAKIQADAELAALNSQTQLAQLSYILQQQQINSQNQLQQNAINKMSRNQQTQDYLGAISTGIQAFFHNQFGNSVDNGGLFGGNSGGWIFH